MEESRIRTLNDAPPNPEGVYVLYWMQQSQRADHNPALEHAIRLANERGEPVLVGFGLWADYPDASERSFAFLLEGLAETAAGLSERGIKLVVRRGQPHEVALRLAKQASLVVCDRGYLRHQRGWRREVAERAGCPVVQVEGDVVVPVDEVSDKAEYAARTIRPKLARLQDPYVRTLSATAPTKSSLPLHVTSELDPSRSDRILDTLRVDRSIRRVRELRGGTSEARRRLATFLRHRIAGYASGSIDPADPNVSRLSPYLHFGQISPVEIARKVRQSKSGSRKDRSAFLEELIVRRELAINFVTFERHYDSFRCLPDWAKKTLSKHKKDARPVRYTARQLERAETEDPYWNAAMRELRVTGYMHNHMRMYWGKKILEWCNTPEFAYRTTLDLNNRYFLDGRDPSSYANVAWIFGLHDQAWGERPIFGKVRFMSAKGLERKFDVEAYVRWVASLAEA